MRWVVALFVGLVGLASWPAHAVPMLFTVASGESFVTATGSMGASVGGVGYQASWASQVGQVAGASGADLPGFGTSDGLTTALSGQLLIDPATGTCGSFADGCLRIDERRSSLQFATSGQWAPATGGASGLDDASFAAFANDAANGVQAEIAIRAFAISLRNNPLFGDIDLVRQSATRLQFEFAQSLEVTVAQGSFDFSSTLPGQPGGSDSMRGERQGSLSLGTLDDLGGGLLRFTLTIDVNGSKSIPLGGADILSANYALTGQLVAYAQQVPEPGLAGMLAIGFVLVARSRSSAQPG